MLIVSRKVGDQIRIGSDVVVSVVEIQGGKVRLGLDLPPDLKVERVDGAHAKGSHPPHKALDKQGGDAR
ncbi:MAG: carbon storage regulator [Succinivibrionaceae bacterium]|nr:carbon storage regulator [Succinivibrionaceae bacterium]